MIPGRGRIGTKWTLAWMLALGLVLRAIIVLTTGGHTWDLTTMAEWSEVLRDFGTSRFYFQAKTGDHLPGDLWIHFWMYQSWNALIPDAEIFSSSGGYLKYLRIVPMTFDILLSLFIFLVLQPLVGNRRALVGTALYLFNPATLLISAMWSQWDVVSMTLIIAALAVVIRRPDRWLLWAVPLTAWAVTIKPPLALPGALILILPLLLAVRDSNSVRDALARLIAPVAKAIAIGLATIVLICLPFNVGLPGMQTQWTLFERANIALDLYPFKVLAAGNIWMLQVATFDHEHPILDDRVSGAFGLDAHTLGNLYLATAVLLIGAVLCRMLWQEGRQQPFVVLAWGCAAVTFATYMLPTRVHERYLFPAFVFMILTIALTGINRRTFAYLTVFSATFVANLAFVYWGFDKGFAREYGNSLFALMLRTSSVINILLFALCIAFAWRWLGRGAGRRSTGVDNRNRGDIIGRHGD